MMRLYMANEILKLSATAAMTGLLAGAGILSGTCMAQASVTFNGVPATSFKVASDTFLTAVVPTGATTGKVVATTPSGALTSNLNFRIIQYGIWNSQKNIGTQGPSSFSRSLREGGALAS